MEKPESQSFPANSGKTPLVAKRTALETPNTTPDAKRIKAKGFYAGLIEPDVKTPAITRRVPFPDKVC